MLISTGKHNFSEPSEIFDTYEEYFLNIQIDFIHIFVG